MFAGVIPGVRAGARATSPGSVSPQALPTIAYSRRAGSQRTSGTYSKSGTDQWGTDIGGAPQRRLAKLIRHRVQQMARTLDLAVVPGRSTWRDAKWCDSWLD